MIAINLVNCRIYFLSMKVLETLQNQLKKEPNYITDNGELKKWVIISKAQSYDPELIGLLLEDRDVKNNFFIEIKGALVFNQSKFVQFLEQKNYLNDSYTSYKNKVGLNIDGKYIKQRNEVSLVFPFKDCILEGGQSRDEDKRDEIFFNEILAQDEITQLLEPKVLTNPKFIDKNGEKLFKGFNRNEKGTITDNLIIKGNNLLTLHSLKREFSGKIKLIYIDPPYNTENDSFTYNDSFTHSSWLTFMKNRLEIAHNLLSEDGIIFVQMDSSRNSQIGTSELPYLNILLDEIFGRKNFIGHLHWKKKKQPSFLSRIAGIMESILIYSKNEEKVGKLSIESIGDSDKPIINGSNPVSEIIFKSGVRVKKNISKINKGVYQTRSMKIEYLDDIFVEEGRTINEFRCKANFRTNQSNINNFIDNDLIFITSNLGLRRDVSDDEKGKSKAITDLLLDWGQNQDADDEIKKLFGLSRNDIFSNPKPELLINNIIKSYTTEDDIIMDFHLGSGTTCAVAHKMNRQYIGVEQMDNIENVAVERIKKVIEGEDGGVSEINEWKGGGEFIYFELKKYNQNFIDKIINSNNIEDLLIIWSEMKLKSFLNYNVDIQKQEQHIEDFKLLTLEEQKQHLIEILDKNQLYVNLSSIKDKDFECSEDEIKITKEFYQIK
jgi:adenine-specific DNA-methyltransferase